MGRVSKEIISAGPGLIQRLGQHGFVHAHIRQHHWNVGHFGAFAMRKLADAIDRVVVVKSQQVVVAGSKRIGLPDDFQRAAGVGRKNDIILCRVGVEILEHIGPGRFDVVGGNDGGGVG